MTSMAPSMGLAVVHRIHWICRKTPVPGLLQVMRKTVLQGVGLLGVVFVEVVLTQVLDIP